MCTLRKENIYAAIDGGGSRSELISINESGDILDHRFGGALNFNDDPQKAKAELIALTEGLPDEAFLYAGIAGAGNKADEIYDTLVRFKELRVESDIYNLAFAELGDKNGCCVIGGTGSACIAKRQNEFKRIGGWGYLIDSRGSGYDIGRMALESMLSFIDGRSTDGKVLLELYCNKFGKTPDEMLSEIYAGGKAFIASLSPLVFGAADQGDARSIKIIDENMAAVSELIIAAERFAGDGVSSFSVVLTGGMLLNYKDAVKDISKRLNKKITVTKASMPQICGAAAGSLALAGISADKSMLEKIKAQLSGETADTL